MSHLDTSDYPIDHPCYSIDNKKILGKFKDEANSKIINRFVGLRAKMYALDIDSQEIKKVKGIVKSAVKNSINFESYIEVLRNYVSIFTKMNIIRSKKHNIESVQINKLSLSPSDDKRIVLDDGISTLAHGHIEYVKA
jgi:hypothetical protein